MNRWLRHHLDTFVVPKLGKGVQVTPLTKTDPFKYYLDLSNPSMVQGLIRSWDRAKMLARGKTMLASGRDSWALAICAYMEGYPVRFVPKFNSTTAPRVKDADKQLFLNMFGIDCGYQGTVFRALGMKHFAVTDYTGRETEHALNPKRQYQSPYNLMTSTGSYWQRAWATPNTKITMQSETPSGILYCARCTKALVEAIEKEPLWHGRSK